MLDNQARAMTLTIPNLSAAETDALEAPFAQELPGAEPARISKKRGDWIQTFSGRRFYPADPRAEDMDIGDVAHALSMICRFNGHTRWHYSVAQHAVLSARQAPREHAFEALHHADTEAWIADLTRPVKHMLPPYVKMEAKIDRVKCKWLGLPHPMSSAVKMIDNRMLVTEASQLLSGRGEAWWREPHWPQPYDIKIKEWTPAYAEEQFLIEHHRFAP